MTVKEFCENYKISHQAVYKKIGRNRDKLKGHIFKSKGKIYELDHTAVEILKPKSVYYKQLDDRNYHLYKKNEKLEAEAIILNEKIENLNESLADKMSCICKLTEENAELKSKNESIKEKVSNLETEISRIKNILHSAKESLAAANAKCEEISAGIGYGGKLVICGDGRIWIKRGQPFANSMGDTSDDQIKRKVINLSVDYLTLN